MWLKSIAVLSLVILLLYTGSVAQVSLFSAYDCREHADMVGGVEQFTVDAAAGEVIFPEDSPAVDTISGWKTWNYVENYAFGKDRGALPMITDLDALHPIFRDRVAALIKACKARGIELAVVETYRTPAKQHEYQTMGRQYTSSGAGKSKHQYGLAIDLVPLVNNAAVWDNTALWRKVGTVGEKLGMRWGGRWRKPYDPGHFEWTGGLTTANLYQGMTPALPDTDDLYPCLTEDLRILRKYWNEWEVQQSSMSRK
jgi:peptidoglycan L-alanyl-D-glutamate endopeptidase CwlK